MFPTWRPSNELPKDGPVYKGTLVRTSKIAWEQATGEIRRAQENFAIAFNKSDTCPAARTAHFDWLPHYEGHVVWNIGWRAEILDVSPEGEGSWIVKVGLSPCLASNTIRTLMQDSVIEIYRLKANNIEFLESDADVSKTKYQHFPIAF